MYINELLPESEASIANEAKKSNMIVSIHNCVVSVLVENGINKPKFMRVNELEDPDKVQAIKRKQNYDNEKPNNRSEENITSPPKKRQFVDNNNRKTKQWETSLRSDSILCVCFYCLWFNL